MALQALRNCCPLRHAPLPRLVQGWSLDCPPRSQLATPLTGEGAGRKVTEGLGERVREGVCVGELVCAAARGRLERRISAQIRELTRAIGAEEMARRREAGDGVRLRSPKGVGKARAGPQTGAPSFPFLPPAPKKNKNDSLFLGGGGEGREGPGRGEGRGPTLHSITLPMRRWMPPDRQSWLGPLRRPYLAVWAPAAALGRMRQSAGRSHAVAAAGALEGGGGGGGQRATKFWFK